jgi:hypothetical protein
MESTRQARSHPCAIDGVESRRAATSTVLIITVALLRMNGVSMSTLWSTADAQPCVRKYSVPSRLHH